MSESQLPPGGLWYAGLSFPVNMAFSAGDLMTSETPGDVQSRCDFFFF